MFKRQNKSDSGAPKVVALRKRSSVTVLDIEGTTLRVVQGSGGRVSRVSETALNLSVEKRDDAKAVGTALKEAKVKAKDVIFALPRGLVVLRPLQTPMVAEIRELASIVNFQVAKDLPFRLEDAIVDFKILRSVEVPRPEGEVPEQRLEVLVGAIKKDTLDFYRTIAREAGLKLDGLAVRPLGHAAIAPQKEGQSALVISLRSDEVTLDIVEHEKLVFSRVAPVTFPQNSETRTAFLQALQIEAVRSLHGHGSAVQKLIVFGQTGLEREFGEALAARLSLPVEFPTQEAFAAAGLALAAMQPAGLALDFENPKKPAVQRNTKRTQTLLAAAASIVVLFSLLGTRAHLIKKREAIKKAVQVEVTDAEKKLLPIYRRLKAQNKVVSGWKAEEQDWLDHFAYLSGILPGADQIYVSAFATTPQHLIRFSVQSKTGELLAELDKTLRAAGYEVKPLSITPANDKHGYHFRTTVELTIPKAMKPDLAKVKAPARPPDDSPAHANSRAQKGAARS